MKPVHRNVFTVRVHFCSISCTDKGKFCGKVFGEIYTVGCSAGKGGTVVARRSLVRVPAEPGCLSVWSLHVFPMSVGVSPTI